MAHLDLGLSQIDVKTAFLNNELDEKFYATTKVFIAQSQDNNACELQHFIYGLK